MIPYCVLTVNTRVESLLEAFQVGSSDEDIITLRAEFLAAFKVSELPTFADSHYTSVSILLAYYLDQGENRS